MDKTGREIILRENLKSFFVHMTNIVVVHKKEGVDQTSGTRGDVRTEDGNFRPISVEMDFKFWGLDEVRNG